MDSPKVILKPMEALDKVIPLFLQVRSDKSISGFNIKDVILNLTAYADNFLC